MISFFRKIRQKLLQQNSFTRYLIYALGEIMLVVIGILIALQVNNWNEGRKQRNIELKYFLNLKNDLYADLDRLNYLIDISKGKVTAASKVKKRADRDSVGSLYDFSTDMLNLIYVEEFRPNDNTYEEMKSSGNFSLIQNDELKLELMTLRKTYIEIQAFQEHLRYDFNVFLQDYERYVNWGKYYDLPNSNVPKSELLFDSTYIENHQKEMESEVRKLLKSKIFLNNIFLLEINYRYDMDVLQNTKSQIEEIIQTLNNELVLE
ncbi:hypothetical protein JYB62_13210 [Algoriphagus lutimaris]|uniref:DUF6090 family protein n=1 Tax=Algoriphagus lutimaris TaxID=613197 RepID=UPI00196A66AC|nr:DUF6090 family protein [Algoriphagus lutimaris]MBN3520961.1 hypothetical protein [Algoriphagus lutimaris]